MRDAPAVASHFSETQRKVAEFVAEHNLEASISTRMLDLTSEVGELAKEVLKSTTYGHQPFSATASFAGELGDVYFSLLCLAGSANLSLEDVLNQALAKYSERLSATADAGSGR